MIHLSSISIPIVYVWATRPLMLWIFIPLTIVAFATEYLRLNVPAVGNFINTWFGSMLRTHELASENSRLSGATYVVLSAALCILIFPKVVTIAAFAVLIVSDTASALYGRRFGRHKFLSKSLEGSAAFVVTAVAVVLVVAAVFHASSVFVIVGVVASIVAAVAEAMSYGVNIDDNLTIPMAFGLTMWGLLALLGGADTAALLAVQ
ncbi:MAG: hypothetical protein JST22_02240 [Bacteroidetes bacterium]|nr:hypothetical protein [Bacteroidota bacterium]